MLRFYFLQKFYKQFILFFFTLALIFAASDLFIRLQIFSSIKIIFNIFILMFPLMAQFAIPLASCMAIQMVIGGLFVEDEIVLFYFFSSARKALHQVVLIFSLSIIVFYIPLTFFWVPQSYKKGKDFILKFAKEKFSQLESNKFHVIIPRLCLFFKNKSKQGERMILEKILLIFSEKNGEKYIINAQKGFLVGHNLFLEKGSLQDLGGQKYHFASFQTTEISLDKVLGVDGNDDKKEQEKPLKFLTWEALKNSKSFKNDVFVEYHKRIAQILWQFFFPFLALWGIFVLGRKKSNLLISVTFGGILFLISYIFSNLGQIFSQNVFFALFLLYFPILFFTSVLYIFYKRKI